MPDIAIRSAGLIAALLLLISGCATRQPALESYLQGTGLPNTLELRDTPFFPQQEYQCGPAALATVLAASDVSVTPDELTGKVYLPERQGSLQLELVAASRRYARLPYPLDAGLQALLGELSAGRPVLVLQNLGLPAYPVWHYAVVVGFDAPRNKLLLRSGDHKRLTMSTRKFMRTWGFADYWSLVTLRPGEMPVAPDKTRYLHAIAALESSGQLDSAAIFYASALSHWPDNTLARFGLGNIHYRQGDPKAAEAQYRRLLAEDPAHAGARNNLAHLLAKRGCREAAIAILDAGLSNPGVGDPLRRHLLGTRSEILGLPMAGGVTGPPCPVHLNGSVTMNNQSRY
jgi:tetratricopeptide (TPR) repeat protein